MEKLINEELIKKYTPMINSLLEKYITSTILRDDLFQEGVMALFIAIQNYDPTLDTEFSDYVSKILDTTFYKYVCNDSMVQFSDNVKNKSVEFKRRREEFCLKFKRMPSTFEMAELMGISFYQIKEIEAYLEPVKSLNFKMNDERDDFLVQEDSLENTIIQEHMEKNLKSDMTTFLTIVKKELDEMDCNILDMHFGFNGYVPMTLKEISEQISEISEARIRHRFKNILKKLRCHSLSIRLLPYTDDFEVNFAKVQKEKSEDQNHLKHLIDYLHLEVEDIVLFKIQLKEVLLDFYISDVKKQIGIDYFGLDFENEKTIPMLEEEYHLSHYTLNQIISDLRWEFLQKVSDIQEIKVNEKEFYSSCFVEKLNKARKFF